MTNTTSSEVGTGTELVTMDDDFDIIEPQGHLSPEIDVNAYDALVPAGGGRTASGRRVNHADALGLGVVWQAVEQISGDLSKIPLNLWIRTPTGSPEIQRASDIYWRIAHQPNRYMHAVRFWRQMWENRLLWGRSYAAIIFSPNRGVGEILPLLPDRTYLERTEDGRQGYVTEVNGQSLWLEHGEVLHLEGIHDHWTGDGIDPIKTAREMIGKALARIGMAARFFRVGGRVGGILELPAGMPKRRRDSTEQSFRKTYENEEEAFRVLVLRENAKFHEAQRTFRDTQMTEIGVEDAKELCRYFNLNPSRIGLEGGRTYNSKTEDTRDYLATTLSPHMTFAEMECAEKFLTPGDRRFNRRWFKYETAELLRMDQLNRYQAHAIGISNEFLTRNEVREIEGLPPLDGGDRLGNPNINPAAHIELLEAICNHQSQVVRDRIGRRKTEPDSAFIERAENKFAASLMGAVRAYTSVFGGAPEQIASAIAIRYVQAVAMGGPTDDLVNEVLRNGS